MRIIYPNGDGASVLIPVADMSLEEVARKDVPASVPYRIVAVSDIPLDRTERAQWAADFSSPDGYGIGPEAWFAEQEANE